METVTAKSSLLREKLREVTTQGILLAAEAELAERGLAASSMQSIAQRAGVSVGTLYNYFKDKEILLSELLTVRRERFALLFNEAMNSYLDLPFEAQLEKIIESVFQIFETQRNFLRIVLANEQSVVPKDAKPSPPFMQFIDRFRPIVAKGVETSCLLDLDADLYASALAALIRSVMIERLSDVSRPFHEATPFVVRIFLNGARVPEKKL